MESRSSADLATEEDGIIIAVLSCSDGPRTTGEEDLRIYATPLEEYMKQLLHWQFPKMCHVAIPYPAGRPGASKVSAGVQLGSLTEITMYLNL